MYRTLHILKNLYTETTVENPLFKLEIHWYITVYYLVINSYALV